MTLARRQLLAAVVLVGALTWALEWALAGAQAAPAAAAVRAVADVAAIAVVGLSVLPALDDPRHRDGLIRAAEGPLIVAAAVWLIAETVRLSVTAAQSAAVGVTRLRLHTVVEFAGTTGGRAELLGLLAAALVGAVAVCRPGTAGHVAMAGATAVGLGARAISGHVGDSAVGAVAIVVHILAAALWCGVLSAAAVTVEHRAQWARILPRLSQLALGCVVVVLVAGTAGALVTVPGLVQLLTTGYGRLLLAKVVVAAGLVGLGWLNRTRWLPATRAHRVSAERAGRYARRELIVMVIALTLAAALALAG